jgi:hypothetical protein
MVLDRLAGFLSNSTPVLGSDSAFAGTQLSIAALDRFDAAPRQLYALLDAYHANNALYQGLQRAWYDAGLPAESLRGLRNPTSLITDFWRAHLWPGDLPDALPIVPGDDVPDGDRLKAQCEQVWAWSNWAAKKQLASHRLSLYGDQWAKVANVTGRPRVIIELVHPAHVTDYDEDERGHCVWVRIDVPQAGRNADGTRRSFTHTEVWSKADQLYRRWEHQRGLDADLRQLGTPDEVRTFAEMGCADFVPLTRTPFRDLGGKRGVGAVLLLKDVIDEVNRKATNLAEMLFVDNASSLFLESQFSPDKPTPPPSLGDSGGSTVTVNKRALWKIPAGWQLNYKVAPINYAAALEALAADLHHLSRLAPELLYWDTAEAQGVESGTARRMRMAPAVARVEEVRGSAESDHARQLMMACTIAKNLGIPGFTDLGDFAKGELDLTFKPRAVIPLTDVEESALLQAKATAYQTMTSAGLSDVFALRAVYDLTDEQIAEEIDRATADAEIAIERQAQAFGDQGQPPAQQQGVQQ